jgi:transcriptional regulator with XRE-family HTH domain
MDDPRLSAARLAAWRSAEGWTQAKVAQAVQTSPEAVGQWENGQRTPSFESAVLLELVSEGALPVEGWGHHETMCNVAKILSLRSRVRREPRATP